MSLEIWQYGSSYTDKFQTVGSLRLHVLDLVPSLNPRAQSWHMEAVPGHRPQSQCGRLGGGSVSSLRPNPSIFSQKGIAPGPQGLILACRALYGLWRQKLEHCLFSLMWLQGAIKWEVRQEKEKKQQTYRNFSNKTSAIRLNSYMHSVFECT